MRFTLAVPSDSFMSVQEQHLVEVVMGRLIGKGEMLGPTCWRDGHLPLLGQEELSFVLGTRSSHTVDLHKCTRRL